MPRDPWICASEFITRDVPILRFGFDGLTHPRPEASNRKKMLAQGAVLLHNSDDSAYSIVPSRTSYHVKDRISHASFESTGLVHRQLNIDNDLFTSRVYKRSHRPLGTVLQIKNRSSIEEGLLESRSVTRGATIRKPIEGTLIAKQRFHLATSVSHDGRQGQQAFLNEGETTSLHGVEESRATRNRFSRKHPGLMQPCIPMMYQDHRYMEETYPASDSSVIKDLPFARSRSAAHLIRAEPDHETSMDSCVADLRQEISVGSNDIVHDNLRPTNPEVTKTDASSEYLEDDLVCYERDSNISTMAADVIAELEANPIKWVVQLSRIPKTTSSKLSQHFLVDSPTVSYGLQFVLGIPGNYDIRRCVSRSKEEDAAASSTRGIRRLARVLLS